MEGKIMMDMLLGYLDDGTPLHRLGGAENDETPNPAEVFGDKNQEQDSKSGSESDEADPESDEEDEDEGDDEDLTTKLSKKQNQIRLLRKDNRNRMGAEKRLRQELEQAQARLKEIDDQEKSELDKAQVRAQELEQQLQKQSELNRQGALEREFLKTGYNWHNSDIAMKLLDESELEYDPDSGKVSGMSKAVKQLAQDHPYLLKSKTEDPESNEPTGQSFNGKKQNNADARRARLEKRFPNLMRPVS